MDHEKAVPWLCVVCGAAYTAVLAEDSPAESRRNVRPEKYQFDHRRLADPPQTVAQFVASLDTSADEADQRAAERHAVCRAAPVLPLDDNLHPAGSAFTSLVRDISKSGISLIHTEPVDAPHVVVELPMANGTKVQLVVQVLRRRSIGPYFEVGGRFITKVGAGKT